MRDQLKNSDSEETLKIHIKKLENKIKNLERSHVIELRYAKERAKERADNILKDKMAKIKECYDLEVENLSA